MILSKRTKALWRLNRVKSDTATIFNDAVYHCAKVSALNHELAFVITKVGIFKGPKVIQIERPRIIEMSEIKDCIIVRDGYIYKLMKEKY